MMLQLKCISLQSQKCFISLKFAVPKKVFCFTKMLDYILRTTQIVARSLQHVQYTIVIVKLSKIIQN